jgi:aspartyl-tRNA(Asn)/glutamyl-tRNA(Gln) amidotransferase subunit B
VRFSISLGLALGCQIAPSSRFAPKNYFYPDLGKNYQISQYDEPIAFEGQVEVELADGTIFEVPIERAHMEEDAGKLTHVGGATGRIQGAEYSLVDYNRAGVPLVEIVTKPIFGAEHRAPELAAAYVRAIRDVVLSLGISRRAWSAATCCDANVSLRPRGQEKLGTRTETKNVNSMRSVERAVRYEIQRQAAILAAGGTITQETRHWHEDTGTTSPGDRSRMPTTTATSRSPTCCRSRRPPSSSRAARRAPGAARRASATEGRVGLRRHRFPGIVNAGCSPRSRRPSPPGPRLPPRASGG